MRSPRPLRARVRTRVSAVVGVATGLALTTGSLAFATIATTNTAADLTTAMAAPGVSVTGSSLRVNYSCTTNDCPTAVSTTPLAGFPDNGASYTVMSTGNAFVADSPNTADNTSEDWSTNNATGIGDTVYDDQVFEIDLGPAAGNCLAFDFRFLSEEYPEFVNLGYNDAFVAQLNTWSVTADPDTQTLTAPGNFAAGAGDQISVDGAGPSSMADTGTAGIGTTYDGSTSLLTARAPVTPGSSNKLYLTLFDQGDAIYDSAVLLDNLRIENAKPGLCKSLSLDPYDGGTGLSQTPGSKIGLAKKKSSLSVPLDCNLPTGPVSCTVSGTASFSPSKAGKAGKVGNAARTGLDRTSGKGRNKLIATGSVTIAPGTSGTLVLQTSTKGKKILKAAAKKPKHLKKKAAKLLVQAAHTHDRAEAAKLRAKAAKLRKKAAKLARKPLGTVTVTLFNPANNITSTVKAKLKR